MRRGHGEAWHLLGSRAFAWLTLGLGGKKYYVLAVQWLDLQPLNHSLRQKWERFPRNHNRQHVKCFPTTAMFRFRRNGLGWSERFERPEIGRSSKGTAPSAPAESEDAKPLRNEKRCIFDAGDAAGDDSHRSSLLEMLGVSSSVEM